MKAVVPSQTHPDPLLSVPAQTGSPCVRWRGNEDQLSCEQLLHFTIRLQVTKWPKHLSGNQKWPCRTHCSLPQEVRNNSQQGEQAVVPLFLQPSAFWNGNPINPYLHSAYKQKQTRVYCIINYILSKPPGLLICTLISSYPTRDHQNVTKIARDIFRFPPISSRYPPPFRNVKRPTKGDVMKRPISKESKSR